MSPFDYGIDALSVWTTVFDYADDSQNEAQSTTDHHGSFNRPRSASVPLSSKEDVDELKLDVKRLTEIVEKLTKDRKEQDDVSLQLRIEVESVHRANAELYKELDDMRGNIEELKMENEELLRDLDAVVDENEELSREKSELERTAGAETKRRVELEKEREWLDERATKQEDRGTIREMECYIGHMRSRFQQRIGRMTNELEAKKEECNALQEAVMQIECSKRKTMQHLDKQVLERDAMIVALKKQQERLWHSRSLKAFPGQSTARQSRGITAHPQNSGGVKVVPIVPSNSRRVAAA